VIRESGSGYQENRL